MKVRIILVLVLILATTVAVYLHGMAQHAARQRVVRCAVIGGMTMTGLWPEIAKMFEEQTGYHVEVIATGERPLLDKAIRAGKVDLLTMHSGDITTDIVADGIGVNMQPWTRNELVIVGPTNDPAGVRGMTNGAEALKKIALAQAKWVDFEGIGSREMTHTLWRLAGVEPKGNWVIKDDTVSKWNVLQFCRSNQAYVVVGYIPAMTGKMANTGMEILVKDDPAMRRPYIVMEANPQKFSDVNFAGARALEEFLLSPKVQNFLLTFGRDGTGNHPLFFPIEGAKAGPIQ
jgi:tungstate transport system substrate-binding protein